MEKERYLEERFHIESGVIAGIIGLVKKVIAFVGEIEKRSEGVVFQRSAT